MKDEILKEDRRKDCLKAAKEVCQASSYAHLKRNVLQAERQLPLYIHAF